MSEHDDFSAEALFRRALAAKSDGSQAKTSASSATHLFQQIACMASKGVSPAHMAQIGTRNTARVFGPNITSKAYSFSELGNVLAGETDDEGSERGAIRHVLWQADIASNFGMKTARDVGDCHEDNVPFDPLQRIYHSSAEADHAVDQHNNRIGRALGWNHRGYTTKQLAVEALNYARTRGVYESRRLPDGTYEVEKKKLNDDTWARLFSWIGKSDENGNLR